MCLELKRGGGGGDLALLTPNNTFKYLVVNGI